MDDVPGIPRVSYPAQEAALLEELLAACEKDLASIGVTARIRGAFTRLARFRAAFGNGSRPGE